MTDTMHPPYGEADLRRRFDWVTARRVAAAAALLVGPTLAVVLLVLLGMLYASHSLP